MKIYVTFIFALILIVLAVNLSVNAVVIPGNVTHQIDKTYNPNEFLRGWINVSFVDEPASSKIRTEVGNGISILDLLKKNQPSAKFTCSPIDCQRGFGLINSEKIKSFELDFGEEKVIGLNITGNEIDAINDIKFEIESNSPPACLNQLEIDFFDDGEIDLINSQDKDEFCLSSKTYNCFNKGAGTEERELGISPYCELITLPQSPKLRAGVWIKKTGSSLPDVSFSMELYDSFGDKIQDANCLLNKSLASSSGSELDCEIDYSVGGLEVEERDHLVCVSSSKENSGYKILANTGTVPPLAQGCGYFGDPKDYSGVLGKGFRIFVEGKKFNTVGVMSVNKTSLKNDAGENLEEIMQNYLQTNYNSRCSDGCTIPIRFLSNTNNQQFNLYDLTLKYTVSGEGQKEENNFYEVSETSPTINSGYNVLNIDDAELSVRGTLGNRTIVLLVGNKTVFTETIKIKQGIDIEYVIPENTAAALPTDFIVGYDSQGKNISKINWYFGDGVNESSIGDRITHSYNSTGLYNMQIELFVTGETEAAASKVFVIEVGSPERILNTSIDKTIAKVNNLKTEIKKLPEWNQDAINEFLEIEDIDSQLRKMKTEYATSSSDDEFTKILDKLVAINLPNSVEESKSATFPFLPQDKVINPAYLNTFEEIDSGDYSSIRNGIYAWNFENINANLEYNEISAYYEYEIKPILNVFDIDIKKKENFNEEYYLFIKGDEKEIDFQGDYNYKEKDSYRYIPLGEEGDNIVFSTTENVDFRDVPAFISPEPRSLPVSKDISISCNNDGKCDSNENKENCGDCKSILPLVSLIILILLIGIILYFLLQIWYKKRYQKFLFKKPNEFYNIMFYINNAKKKGLTESQIRMNLNKAKWSNEQIDFAMKKYQGKSTGMRELPISKFIKIKSKEKGGESRKGKHIDKKLMGKPEKMVGKPEKKKGFFSIFKNMFKKKDKNKLIKTEDKMKKSTSGNVVINNRKPIK